MFLYFGKGISEGLIPYKDMFDHKGIVLFFIQYIANIVGLGNIFLGIFLVEAVFINCFNFSLQNKLSCFKKSFDMWSCNIDFFWIIF